VRNSFFFVEEGVTITAECPCLTGVQTRRLITRQELGGNCT